MHVCMQGVLVVNWNHTHTHPHTDFEREPFLTCSSSLSPLELILDVRGLGMMNAMEFDPAGVRPGAAARVSQHCLQHGMLVLPCSAFETLRFIPPLNVTESELSLGMSLLESAIDAVAQE
jgi:4-aminobutyrate aminotransferase-like enzyme